MGGENWGGVKRRCWPKYGKYYAFERDRPTNALVFSYAMLYRGMGGESGGVGVGGGLGGEQSVAY